MVATFFKQERAFTCGTTLPAEGIQECAEGLSNPPNLIFDKLQRILKLLVTKEAKIFNLI